MNDTPMVVWYHLASDINRQAAEFKFNYSWKPICQCGELELQAEEGVWKQLTSPDYPNNYCNSMQCQYLITAPPGYHVAVNITELFLEPNEDVLAIFDGSNITDQRIRLFVFVFFFFGH
ncbi:unnamed protein product [Gongylonema pulchrum]|uniref:CUB domain-containing protein n=1 Tax=Gongylonema pulchrum TaxID=637853 RepID=A0A183EGT5_9BILA|nr:unnamed protein product [Gongylonema pulchrum]